LFISAFIVTAQNGFGLDVDPLLHLCRETWGEEVLFDAVKDLPHGALTRWDVEDTLRLRLTEEQMRTVVGPHGKKRTRLMYAAQAGDLARLRWLLARGARVGLLDWRGRSALWWACESGRLDCVRELLARGARLEERDCQGWAPIHAACLYGHLHVVRALVFRGASVSARTTTSATPLFMAAALCHEPLVRQLLAWGADASEMFGSRTVLAIIRGR
jgi:ankyrin repeat protein